MPNIFFIFCPQNIKFSPQKPTENLFLWVLQKKMSTILRMLLSTAKKYIYTHRMRLNYFHQSIKMFFSILYLLFIQKKKKKMCIKAKKYKADPPCPLCFWLLYIIHIFFIVHNACDVQIRPYVYKIYVFYVLCSYVHPTSQAYPCYTT